MGKSKIDWAARKDEMIALRESGLSIIKTAKALGCARSTVERCLYPHYDSNLKQRQEKTREMRQNNSLFILNEKVKVFQQNRKSTGRRVSANNSKIHTILNNKITKFSKPYNWRKGMKSISSFGAGDILKKIGDSPVCYLTGEPIDLANSSSYVLDHIVPRSRGGDNSIDNCQIASYQANLCKSNLTYEEFVLLCSKIVNHNNQLI